MVLKGVTVQDKKCQEKEYFMKKEKEKGIREIKVLLMRREGQDMDNHRRTPGGLQRHRRWDLAETARKRD